MKLRLYALLASTSIVAIASTAHAADPAAAPQSQVAQASMQQEEIVVTARRKAENLEVVPETVDVVGAQDIEKYNMTQFTDIQKLVPGLKLDFNAGFGQE